MVINALVQQMYTVCVYFPRPIYWHYVCIYVLRYNYFYIFAHFSTKHSCICTFLQCKQASYVYKVLLVYVYADS
jgi:hypothetical protein